MGAFEGASFHAGRDQYIAAGDQHMTVQSITVDSTLDEMRPTIDSLRRDAEQLLPRQASERVAAELDGLAKDMDGPKPDRAKAASRLDTVVETVKKSGEVVEAGTSIFENIVKIATWIGPIAAGALGLLN
ncbi:hypothetical protein [Agromyces sp. SYSU T00266]|uniref:hypothetical protein n=1 Tax=Agromyces zhanjiangensis TaxID=3158562 RepID=UPI003399BF67